MTMTYSRRYTGPLKAVVLDWAGTTVDHGCMAPADTFIAAFKTMGVEITVAQAREPMGMPKWNHIETITQMAPVAAAWEAKYGKRPDSADVDALYARFLPLQIETVASNSDVIPGVLDTVSALRTRGLKIASTTGYPREVMEVVFRVAKDQGYEPDVTVCAGDTPAGRPGPFMALQALVNLSISPVEAVVKIGDTVVDIEEGLNGGMWTIGLAATGNEVGLTAKQYGALSASERNRLTSAAADKLARAGAHYVVNGLADVLPVINMIEARLARGEKP
jgi:phosphonoacetaldehyde hydrolase